MKKKKQIQKTPPFNIDELEKKIRDAIEDFYGVEIESISGISLNKSFIGKKPNDGFYLFFLRKMPGEDEYNSLAAGKDIDMYDVLKIFQQGIDKSITASTDIDKVGKA